MEAHKCSIPTYYVVGQSKPDQQHDAVMIENGSGIEIVNTRRISNGQASGRAVGDKWGLVIVIAR